MLPEFTILNSEYNIIIEIILLDQGDLDSTYIAYNLLGLLHQSQKKSLFTK